MTKNRIHVTLSKTENNNPGECQRVSKHFYRPQQSPDSFQWKTIIRAQLKQKLHINGRSLANRIKRMQIHIYMFIKICRPALLTAALKKTEPQCRRTSPDQGVALLFTDDHLTFTFLLVASHTRRSRFWI